MEQVEDAAVGADSGGGKKMADVRRVLGVKMSQCETALCGQQYPLP